MRGICAVRSAGLCTAERRARCGHRTWKKPRKKESLCYLPVFARTGRGDGAAGRSYGRTGDRGRRRVRRQAVPARLYARSAFAGRSVRGGKAEDGQKDNGDMQRRDGRGREVCRNVRHRDEILRRNIRQTVRTRRGTRRIRLCRKGKAGTQGNFKKSDKTLQRAQAVLVRTVADGLQLLYVLPRLLYSFGRDNTCAGRGMRGIRHRTVTRATRNAPCAVGV